MISYDTKVDIRRPIRTPEGGDLTVRVAGPVPRAIAWVLDLTIRTVGYLTIATMLAIVAPGGLYGALVALLIFAGEWLYSSLAEGLYGTTPGKKVMGLAVVQRDGSPCGLEAAFIRNIVRFVDLLPPIYGFGLVSMLFSPDFQRLGDRAAGTVVVYRSTTARRRASVAHQAWARAVVQERDRAEPMAPPVALTGEEEAAILEFVQEAPTWGVERATEVTDYAAALTGEVGAAGRRRIFQYAAWLDGRRER